MRSLHLWGNARIADVSWATSRRVDSGEKRCHCDNDSRLTRRNLLWEGIKIANQLHYSAKVNHNPTRHMHPYLLHQIETNQCNQILPNLLFSVLCRLRSFRRLWFFILVCLFLRVLVISIPPSGFGTSLPATFLSNSNNCSRLSGNCIIPPPISSDISPSTSSPPSV